MLGPTESILMSAALLCTTTQLVWIYSPIFLFQLLPFQLLLQNALFLVIEPLLSLYILEHIFIFRDANIVGEHLGTLLIKFIHLRQPSL